MIAALILERLQSRERGVDVEIAARFDRLLGDRRFQSFEQAGRGWTPGLEAFERDRSGARVGRRSAAGPAMLRGYRLLQLANRAELAGTLIPFDGATLVLVAEKTRATYRRKPRPVIPRG